MLPQEYALDFNLYVHVRRSICAENDQQYLLCFMEFIDPRSSAIEVPTADMPDVAELPVQTHAGQRKLEAALTPR